MLKNILVSSLLVLLLTPLTLRGAEDNCLTCHQEFEDEDGPSHMIARDIHTQRGLGCVDCHGGDTSLEDMDEVREVAGYRGVPDYLEVPDFCARCHSDAAYMRNHNPSLPTDQLDKYRTSIHGQRLFENRDRKVANCISCHTVHEIGDGRLPHSSTHPLNVPATCGKCHADADYMAEYGIPADQLEDFQNSVHGHALLEEKDLGAPACNDCHSNHGAAPPGVSSLSAVCGSCHAFQMELFAASPHDEAFRENEFPMCESCHSNHRILKPVDDMVGTEDPAVCVECHDADDGTRAFAVADSMSASLGRLTAARARADTVLNEAITKGMHTTDEEFLLKDVDQILIQAQTMVHAFSLEDLVPKAVEGIAKADSVETGAQELIEEYYFRRKGLALATLFITILAVGLYLKIRRLG
jgi:predicted CXXCH cytochrome family protein